MKQHKWHKEIKAWADGAEIEARFRQWLDIGGFQWTEWKKCREPFWHNDEETEYRIKPQPKEPQYLYAYKDYVRDDGSTTSKITISSTRLYNENYIGKIKLEDTE